MTSPLLPQPEQPTPGDAFSDRILLLLAAVLVPDGMLTYHDYLLTQNACRDIFGEQALHAELQAKLHYALLAPPRDPLELARRMAEQAEAENVDPALLRSLLTVLPRLLPTPPEQKTEELAATTQALAAQLVAFVERTFAPPAPASPNEETEVPQAPESSGMGERLGARLAAFCRSAGRLFPSAKSSPLPATTGLCDGQVATSLGNLERVAHNLADKAMQEDLRAFRKVLEVQPFRIVVVGERKRGKSSLINALLGESLSPVRESVPETATVVEFSHAAHERYSVTMLDAEQFRFLQAQLADGDNLLLRAKRQRLEAVLPDFVPGQTLELGALDELPDYVCQEGRYADLTARARIATPQAPEGVLLVDTPGLNDTDLARNALAREESLSADCVIFALDARDPGTSSELELLRALIRSGRAVTVIGTLTNIDRLNSPGSLMQARERAELVLREACRAAPHVRFAGLTALNVRRLAESSGTGQTMPEEFRRLLSLIHEAMDSEKAQASYKAKVANRFGVIASLVREKTHAHRESVMSSLPAPGLLAMLDSHAAQLAEATRQSMERASQVTDAAARDLQTWEEDSARSLDRFYETLVLRLMDAVNARANSLGRHFARERDWQRFEEDEARAIARQTVDEFLEEQRAIMTSWETKLRIFSQQLQTVSQSCLETAEDNMAIFEDGELRHLFVDSGGATNLLVQTHYYMKNLAVFATGAALGRATLFSPITLLLTAGNVLVLTVTSPFLATAVLAAAGTVGFLCYLGKEEKLRKLFLKYKRRQIEAYAGSVRDRLREQLTEARTELGRAYEQEVRRGFMPALESLLHQSVHLRLFLDVMQRIRADAALCDAHAENRLVELHSALSAQGLALEPATPQPEVAKH